MIFSDFKALADLFPNEEITYSRRREIPLAGVGTCALITLDNNLDGKPTLLGPNTLIELGTLLSQLKERAAAGEIVAVAVTGKPGYLAAGADLSAIRSLKDHEGRMLMARLGHEVYGVLDSLGVPTFSFINGAALGGGLELALAASYRTVSAGANTLVEPEQLAGALEEARYPSDAPQLYGDGHAAERVAAALYP